MGQHRMKTLKLSKKETERLREVLHHEVKLDMEACADTGHSWKQACDNLRLLRSDSVLLEKLVRALEKGTLITFHPF
jgi:hypothetical protein